jgi:two-component system, OmpR family, phosphate regulon response regulator OmpR
MSKIQKSFAIDRDTKFKHVLVVDDDEGIRDLLAKFLHQNGYIINKASSTAEADLLLKTFVFDILIVDIMMEPEDGLSFIKRNKNSLNAPVIMLTALDGVDDRINGLETGADDYLAKPFSPKELLLRIQKLLERSKYGQNKNFQSLSTDNNEQIRFGEYAFDFQKNVLLRNGKRIYLTNLESNLLKILGNKAGKVVARTELVSLLNNQEQNPNKNGLSVIINTRTIDTQIARLRSKIEKVSKQPEFLQTVRGIGYVLWAIQI